MLIQKALDIRILIAGRTNLELFGEEASQDIASYVEKCFLTRAQVGPSQPMKLAASSTT